jgi:hypothetical protein
MGENDREADSSRLDTAPLQNIGRDDLTCREVEDFLENAIMAGRGEEDEDEIASMSTAPMESLRRQLTTESIDGNFPANTARVTGANSAGDSGIPRKVLFDGNGYLDAPSTNQSESAAVLPVSVVGTSSVPIPKDVDDAAAADEYRSLSGNQPFHLPGAVPEKAPTISVTEGSSLGGDSSSEDNPVVSREGQVERNVRPATPVSLPTPTAIPSTSLAIRKYFWTTVAVGSFTLGIGCLLMGMGAFEQRPRGRRYISISPKYR